MSEPAPVRLGRYRLEGVVGTGAFSTVHRAFDERLEDVVAVKVLAENHSLDGEVRERFLAEGRVLRRIDSPHVIEVYDLGETDQLQPYLVLELAAGGTLAQRVAARRGGGWTPQPDEVLAVATTLASALDAVHRAEVVHRDLSPSNVLLGGVGGADDASSGVLVGPTERLLLADLGLCKDLALHSGLTAAGGTSGFRPPEQRRGPGTITPTADLWALSALVVWLVTGAAPVEGASIRRAVGRAGMPAALGRALERGLVDDPRRRPPDVDAWRDAVTSALEEPAPSPDPREPATIEAAPSRRSLGRRVARAAGLVGAGLALGAALAAGVVAVGDRPTVTDLGGGQVRVERQDGDAAVALVGPASVTVGETAVFTVDASDLVRWVWIDPGGQLHPDASGIEVTATSPGPATVRLVATTAGGAVLEASHRLVVRDPGS